MRILFPFLLATLFVSLSFNVRAQTNAEQPYANMGGYKSGTKLAADVIKAQKGLKPYLKEEPKQKQLSIISYTVVVDKAKGDPETINCQGSEFSEVTKQKIAQYLTPGLLISFENIRAVDEKGKQWKIPSIFYVIE